jgi:multidrug efflux system membrane fusion protein
MKSKWAWALVIAVVLGVTALILREQSRTATTVSTPDRPPSPLVVSVASASRRDLPIVVHVAGRAEAKASVVVKSRLDGEVAAVLFTEGGPVHKGQALLRMDPAPTRAQLRQAQAVLARDQAQLDKVRGDALRNTALFQQGFISKSGLGQTEADLAAARATVRADEAAIDSARLQLGFTEVVSPVDGVAGTALLPVGGAAKANDTALVVINQFSPIRVAFPVPESELPSLKSALSHGPVEVMAQVPGAATRAAGRLEFLDNAVDPTTGTIMARAAFTNADRALTPGQYVELTITLGHLGDGVVVPDAAVESGVDGPYVFVVKPDATVEVRPVKLSGRDEGFAAIATGLAAGERVVIDGQSRLRAGSVVQVAPAPAAASATMP